MHRGVCWTLRPFGYLRGSGGKGWKLRRFALFYKVDWSSESDEENVMVSTLATYLRIVPITIISLLVVGDDEVDAHFPTPAVPELTGRVEGKLPRRLWWVSPNPNPVLGGEGTKKSCGARQKWASALGSAILEHVVGDRAGYAGQVY